MIMELKLSSRVGKSELRNNKSWRRTQEASVPEVRLKLYLSSLHKLHQNYNEIIITIIFWSPKYHNGLSRR